MNISREGRVHLDTLKFVEALDGARIQRGDVLFNNTNSPELVGKTACFDRDGEWAYSNHMTRLRPASGIDGRFLASQLHWLWMTGFFKSILKHHVNQASVATKTLLSSVRVVVPPLGEQRRIMAAIEEQLSRLDHAAALVGAAVSRAHRMKLLILNTAFSSLSGETVALREVAEVRLGRQRSPRNHLGPTMKPYLRAANVTWDGLKLDDVKEMNFSDDEADVYGLRSGDVLLAEASGSASEVGKPVVWRDEIPGCCFQNTLIRVRSRGPDPEYLRVVFLRAALSGQFAQAAPGVGIHHLGSSRLADWPIPVCSEETQSTLVDAVERQFSLIDALVSSLASVVRRGAALRLAILALAFRGKLVPQDTHDEPASALLERIAAELPAPKPKRQRREKRPA